MRTGEFRTEQEAFWAGEFGDDYIGRNRSPRQVAANLALFGKVLESTAGIESILELGANIGQNLAALRSLLPDAGLAAVEINAKAVAALHSSGLDVTVHHTSILDFRTDEIWDLVFTKGVLIHVDPDHLPGIYDCLFGLARRYVLLVEYYNPRPVEIDYRGHAHRLFKRDFAGDMLDRFPSLELRDYGFVYHSDRSFPLDDMTWFLLEKKRQQDAN